MTYVEADGPPDIDSVHAFATLADPETEVEVNQQGAGASLTPPLPTLPWIKLLSVTGWDDLPEHDNNQVPRTLAPGLLLLPGDELGATFVYECEVRANTRETLRRTHSDLWAVLRASMTDPAIVTVTPYVGIGGPTWKYAGRVLDAKLDRTWRHHPMRRAPFRRGFTITLLLPDPNIYLDDDFVAPDPLEA